MQAGFLFRVTSSSVFLMAICFSAFAQSGSYPNKPIKFVVGFAAGSATDTAARIIAERLRPQIGQQILVENRPGAASSIATELVANSPGDGYTLLFSSSSATVNAAAYNNASTQAYRSLLPIALVASIPNILVVNSSLGVKSVKGLITLAKLKPGEISYASSGAGSSPHMSAELFEARTGIQMQHVPYKGSSQAMNDVLSGLVPVMFSPASTVLPHINSGKLIPLATTSNKRTPLIAVPTLEEAGVPDFNVALWFGILAPKGTDAQIVNKLSGAITKALDDPETKKLFTAQTMDITGADPAEFKVFINSEIGKWAGLIKTNKIDLN
jgi:tripartite-type tricarboxylate transporter receptor subunit TctC